MNVETPADHNLTNNSKIIRTHTFRKFFLVFLRRTRVRVVNSNFKILLYTEENFAGRGTRPLRSLASLLD
ncbi:hypothetical protein LIL_13569 [Leptospira interrogans serovar Linhai str. 56609]|nr:hypothetical protein LIL_13569 [Leptospira interrogans serovar Linhai str. 56609]